jgi:hypothetical protein
MNFGTNPYDIAFWIMAPLLATISLRARRRTRVFLALGICALFGWGLGFLANGWIDAQWEHLIDRTPNATPDLINQADSDAASKAAMLLFGLPVSVVYSAAWFGVVHGLRRLIRRFMPHHHWSER